MEIAVSQTCLRVQGVGGVKEEGRGSGGRMPRRWGSLYHMQEKKNKLARETCLIKEYTSCFRTALKTSPSDNSRHSKRYPAFDLVLH